MEKDNLLFEAVCVVGGIIAALILIIFVYITS